MALECKEAKSVGRGLAEITLFSIDRDALDTVAAKEMAIECAQQVGVFRGGINKLGGILPAALHEKQSKSIDVDALVAAAHANQGFIRIFTIRSGLLY